MERTAVVLLSGGLDSTTLVAFLRALNIEVHTLSVDYGQRHSRELRAAQRISKYYRAKSHRVLRLAGLKKLLQSTLTGHGEVPSGSYDAAIRKTVVPARNSILLSIAYGYAASLGADLVAYAAHATDGAHYPDTTPTYVVKMEAALQEGNFQKIPVVAPFVNLTKSDIVRVGAWLQVPWELTWSCYRGGEKHCGICPTCIARQTAFREAGIPDPTEYEVEV